MKIGLKNKVQSVVTEDKLACNVKSGTLRVYATPMMAALIEQTCMECVAAYLEEGSGTVGTRLDISHVAPTPLGMNVECECELTEINNRKLTFKVTVSDQCGLIGEGTHERFIVKEAKFQQKADAKLAPTAGK